MATMVLVESVFPKDLNAIIHFCLTNGVEPVILKAAWEKNMQVREEHDWLQH